MCGEAFYSRRILPGCILVGFENFGIVESRMHKQLAIALLLMFAIGVSSLKAEQREMTDFADLLQLVDPDALLLLDIDNTLIVSGQQLGTTSWGWDWVARLSKMGRDKAKAYQETYELWKRVLQASSVKLVDDRIPAIISHFQDKGVAVLGLSNRVPQLGHVTTDQLLAVRIDLTRTALVRADVGLAADSNVRYIEGSFYVGDVKDKGYALSQLLEILPQVPRKIVFVDDRYRNVVNVGKVCEQRGIAYLGIWYRATDGHEDSYRADLADVQLKYFGSILSDEDAKKLIESGVK